MRALILVLGVLLGAQAALAEELPRVPPGRPLPRLQKPPRPSARQPAQSSVSRPVADAAGQRVFAATITHGHPSGVSYITEGGPVLTITRGHLVESIDESFNDVAVVGDARSFDGTGVLVAERAVLTARHCLPATRVGFGTVSSALTSDAQVIATTTPDDPTVDVALLYLDRTPPVTPRVMRTAADVAPPVGMVRLVGFGTDDSTGTRGFGRKREVDVPAPGWGCEGARVHEAGCDPALELLLPRYAGRDTCDGDSGGPAFEHTATAWRLVAITSRPVGNAGVRCGAGGIYVRVDRIRDWIDAGLSAGPALTVSEETR